MKIIVRSKPENADKAENTLKWNLALLSRVRMCTQF